MDGVKLLLNIDVPDVEAASRFYVEAFGFRVGRRLGAVGVELLGAPVPLYLLASGEGSVAVEGTPIVRSYARHWTPLHIDLVVPDVAAARERALAAGARAQGGITEHEFGRMARLSDPFGHGVCLIEFNALGYDAIATSDASPAAPDAP